jgi:hypothetical protein
VILLLNAVTYRGLAAPQDDPESNTEAAEPFPHQQGEPFISGPPGRVSLDTPKPQGFAEGAKNPHPAAWPLWFASDRSQAVCCRRATALARRAWRTYIREDGLDSRQRLTCLAAIRDGGRLAGETTNPAAWEPRCAISAVELSSCQGQTDRQCSSKVQQPGRLTFDLHRPKMTL